MAMKIDKVQLAGTKYDKRAKLNDDQRNAILILSREGYSQRKLATMFNVSKRLVQSILHPPARTPPKPKSTEYWTEVKRRYRARKAQLYSEGKLKSKPKTRH